MGLDTSSVHVTGGAADFLEFITSEVIPYVDSLYPTNEHRTLIGHSLGGLAVFHAWMHHQTSFDQYLAIDPYLDYDKGRYLSTIMDSLKLQDHTDHKLYVAAAMHIPSFLDLDEIDTDTSEITAIVRSNRRLKEYADNANLASNVHCASFAGENHFSIPNAATTAGFRWFYQDFPFPEIMDYYHPANADRTDLIGRLTLHYQQLSEELGYTVKPMESYLNSFAYGLDYFGRSDLSKQLLNYSIQTYPNRASTYKSKGQYLQSKGSHNEALLAYEKSLDIKEDADLAPEVKKLRAMIEH